MMVKPPLDVKMALSVMNDPSISQKENPDREKMSLASEPNPFERVLSDRLGRMGENVALPKAGLTLDKEGLWHLVAMMEMQLNRSLFRSLTDSPEEEPPHGIPFDLMNPIGMDNRLESRPATMDSHSGRTEGTPSPVHCDPIIDQAATTYGMDPYLVRAVIKAESDFNPNCTSSKGAMGLMQLMPETAKELGVKDPYSPVENIMAGTRYLRMLLDRYEGNVPLALAAYNWGMGNLERQPDRLPQETRTYIMRVQQYYHEVNAQWA